MNEIKNISTVETVKILKQKLKEEFPKVNFSVRSKKYSGGSSINIEWTDGPSTKTIDSIVKDFEGASFDGMQDLESYKDTIFNGEKVHFSAKYIFTYRNISEEKELLILKEILKEFKGVKSLERFNFLLETPLTMDNKINILSQLTIFKNHYFNEEDLGEYSYSYGGNFIYKFGSYIDFN